MMTTDQYRMMARYFLGDIWFANTEEVSEDLALVTQHYPKPNSSVHVRRPVVMT